jgi:hypothetical protein
LTKGNALVIRKHILSGTANFLNSDTSRLPCKQGWGSYSESGKGHGKEDRELHDGEKRLIAKKNDARGC